MGLHFGTKKEVLKANLTNLPRGNWSPKLTLKLVPESLLGSLPVVQWVIQWVVHWIVSWVVSRIVSLVLFLSLLFLPEGIVHRHGFLLPPLHAFGRNWCQSNFKVLAKLPAFFDLQPIFGSLLASDMVPPVLPLL